MVRLLDLLDVFVEGKNAVDGDPLLFHMLQGLLEGVLLDLEGFSDFSLF